MFPLLIAATFITISIVVFVLDAYKKDPTLPPGPWNLPIIGCLHMLDPKTPYLSLTNLAQKYGPIYSIKLGKINTVVICDAKLLKKVLMKDEVLERPQLYILDYLCRGKGITYSYLKLWKEQRKFTTDFLRSVGAAKVSAKKEVLENEIRRSGEEFVKVLETQEDSITFLSKAVTNYVSRITSLLFLGKSCPSDGSAKFIQLIEDVVKISVEAGPLNFLPFLRFVPLYANVISVISNAFVKMHSFMDDLIKNTGPYFTNEKSDFLPSIINVFMQKKVTCTSEVYNVEQLRYLIADMLGASTETTATSILWIILYLAKYEKVQEKVHRELVSVLQGKSPQMGYLEKLPYTEATIAEVARIRTTVAMGVPHLASEDIYIENFKIQKNTMIMPLLWAIHMDPKVWNEPENFRPDRFLNDEGRFFQPEEFLPFSVGKRMCIGEQLAKMMIFIFVATVFQNFKIESCNSEIDLSAVCGITLLPKPHKISFTKI